MALFEKKDGKKKKCNFKIIFIVRQDNNYNLILKY